MWTICYPIIYIAIYLLCFSMFKINVSLMCLSSLFSVSPGPACPLLLLLCPCCIIFHPLSICGIDDLIIACDSLPSSFRALDAVAGLLYVFEDPSAIKIFSFADIYFLLQLVSSVCTRLFFHFCSKVMIKEDLHFIQSHNDQSGLSSVCPENIKIPVNSTASLKNFIFFGMLYM